MLDIRSGSAELSQNLARRIKSKIFKFYLFSMHNIYMEARIRQPKDFQFQLAKRIRRNALKMAFHAGLKQGANCLSCADVLSFLYSSWLNIDRKYPYSEDRDRFILSKGHAAPVYYATLAEQGLISSSWLDEFGKDNSPLGVYVTHSGIPGIEFSSGSLGHGLPVGVGMAWVLKKHAEEQKNHLNRVVVLISDNECDDGTTWESALIASQLKLNNLTVIIDFNELCLNSKNKIHLESLINKWKSFGWVPFEVDGHSFDKMEKIFRRVAKVRENPVVVITHTRVGKGVSTMESKGIYLWPQTESELEVALKELE